MLTSLLTFSIAFVTFYSVTESKLEVASSNINILAYFNNALAIEILYFSPPLSLSPLSPTKV